MNGHRMDSYLYMMSAFAARQSRHDHLLMKDPRQLAWRCQAEDCGFTKPAHEFDGIRVPT